MAAPPPPPAPPTPQLSVQAAVRMADNIEEVINLVMELGEGLLDLNPAEAPSPPPASTPPPAPAPAPSPAQDPRKRCPPRSQGFLVQLRRYAQHRILTSDAFCVICDRPHIFSGGSMLKPAVCTRDLCVFAFQVMVIWLSAGTLFHPSPPNEGPEAGHCLTVIWGPAQWRPTHPPTSGLFLRDN